MAPVSVLRLLPFLPGLLAFRPPSSPRARGSCFARRSDWLPLEPDRCRIAARVHYDGSQFQGFQFQPQVRSVQGELERALQLSFPLPLRGLRITGAGRTDAGVHALGQAVHFDVPLAALDAETKRAEPGAERSRLERRINEALSLEVRVWNVTMAPPPARALVSLAGGPRELRQMPWHALHSAMAKLYVYHFSVAGVANPLGRRHRAHFWRLRHEDMATFARCLALFEGVHDFKSFANRTQRERAPRGSVREIFSARLIHEGGDDYRVEIHLRSALYKMVRNIVGFCEAVAAGELDLDSFETVKALGHRGQNPTKSAPAHGLLLAHVCYDEYGCDLPPVAGGMAAGDVVTPGAFQATRSPHLAGLGAGLGQRFRRNA